MSIARAMRCGIYKHEGQDFSNHGISSQHDNILLLNEEGWIDVDLDNPPENLCIFVERELFGKEANYIRPYEDVDTSSHTDYMAGGTLVWTSDSRFPSNHPLELHDRTETYDDYEAYSH